MSELLAHEMEALAVRLREMVKLWDRKAGHDNLVKHLSEAERLLRVAATAARKSDKPDPKKPKIEPVNQAGDSRTGRLSGIKAKEITAILGFAPNVDDDPSKVRYSWGFTVDGERCGVWDYKGSGEAGAFSTWGPADKLRALFGDRFDHER